MVLNLGLDWKNHKTHPPILKPWNLKKDPTNYHFSSGHEISSNEIMVRGHFSLYEPKGCPKNLVLLKMQ